MSKYLLYPGCSMDSSGWAYGASIKAITEPLDLNLEEIDDWNCCGATEYLGINLIPAYSLIARNLALAAKQMNGTRTVDRTMFGLLSQSCQGGLLHGGTSLAGSQSQ